MGATTEHAYEVAVETRDDTDTKPDFRVDRLL
jgi:hypothetical protein